MSFIARMMAITFVLAIASAGSSQATNYSGSSGWSKIAQLNIHPTSVLVYLENVLPTNGCATPVFRLSLGGSGDNYDFHRATLLSAKMSEMEIALRYDIDDVNDCKINVDTVYIR